MVWFLLVAMFFVCEFFGLGVCSVFLLKVLFPLAVIGCVGFLLFV